MTEKEQFRRRKKSEQNFSLQRGKKKNQKIKKKLKKDQI